MFHLIDYILMDEINNLNYRCVTERGYDKNITYFF